MKNFRVKRMHVLLAGLPLSAGVVVLFLFMFAKPLQDKAARLDKQVADQQVIAARKSKADRDKKEAEAQGKTTDHVIAQILENVPVP